MGQENPAGADPATDTDEEALDRALSYGRAEAAASAPEESAGEYTRPATGPPVPLRADGSPAARRSPESSE
ncbi:hypothetical protein JL475_29755 [Streptomyces sp. M2CJ-2]|uniref:hypothetical protein n=1 Tax=Streptomyces sp. M2CJ-2 TaxID=2803948 RepID=UPI001927EF17|nr:hypothetical protein [Streptomyces sp. M2CJ-2]MBL3670093.1 hypothetical protein [Streptomyces sp. M2CJ-2]